MKYFSIFTVSFEIFQTIFILHTFTLTDTLRKNKSSVMVADTNPITESSWNMDWEDRLSQR